MKSFREQQNDHNTPGTGGVTEDAPAYTEGSQQDLAQQAAALAGLNEQQLTARLMAEAANARAQGNLNDDALQAFYNQMAPMLTPEQSDKMAQLIALIKG